LSPQRLPLTAPAAGIVLARESGPQRAREFFFLAAVVLMNYTLFRPSPVDVSFTIALALTIFCRQRITFGTFAYLALVLVWLSAMVVSSLRFLDDDEVTYQITKISFATSIGLGASLLAAHWSGAKLRLFLRIWIFGALIAATLGIVGFAGGVEDFVWDGRAKGLFDDPNMYGAYLLPGILACVHALLTGEGRRGYHVLGGLWLTLGLLLSFSRVAIAAGLVLVALQLVILNRRALARTLVYGAGTVVAVLVLGLIAAIFIDGFDDKVLDRFTLAKDYDLGAQGRLGRYVGSIAFILSFPGGLGLLQYERMFPEPIHNIWISSFMNYGWTAGFAFTVLMIFAVVNAVRTYRLTRDQICLTILFAWVAIASCAMLHEAERWRHLWLMTGLVWGLDPRNWRMIQAPRRPVGRSMPVPSERAPALSSTAPGAA
jgi:O-antigen ligase